MSSFEKLNKLKASVKEIPMLEKISSEIKNRKELALKGIRYFKLLKLDPCSNKKVELSLNGKIFIVVHIAIKRVIKNVSLTELPLVLS